jgi:hypothetical protein
MVQNQPGKTVYKILSQKNPSQKRADGVVQSIGPEFKPQYWKKNDLKIRVKDHVLYMG